VGAEYRDSSKREILDLLEQNSRLLASITRTFDRREPNSLEERYLWCMAVAVNQAAEGFALLRSKSLLAASKLMLRPAIEATICAKAALATKEFYFRKVYSEWSEDLKLFEKDPVKRKTEESQFDRFRARFMHQHPGYPAKKSKLPLLEAARAAGPDFVNNYEYAYRLYCQWTHNTMRPVLKRLPLTDHIDPSIMCWCVLCILDSLKGRSPAAIPDLAQARRRLEELSASA
jgi:hypothetical protein